MFMRTYASSRVKRKSFYRKSELQMFLLISGGHIGAPKRNGLDGLRPDPLTVRSVKAGVQGTEFF